MANGPVYPWLDHSQPFTPATLFGYPGTRAGFAPSDNAVSPPDRPKSVCVIGGGIAGLTAAYELTRARHNVLVLEREPRLGGRIRTVRFSDGTYGELGAMRIPEEHQGVLHYVNEFHLGPMRKFRPGNPNGYLHLRGASASNPPLRIKERELLAARYPSADATLFQNLPAEVVGSELLTKRLSGAPAWWKLYEGNVTDTDLEGAERTSLWQAMTAPRATHTAGRFNPEEWAYLGRASGFAWLEDASLLEHMVDAYALLSEQKWEIRGGMDLLVGAFAEELGDRVITNAEVKEIRVERATDRVGGADEKGRLLVTWHDRFRGPTTRRFDYAIVAVPAPAAARLRFQPPLPAHVYEALTGISYASSAKSVVHCRRRVWEDDGIVGGSSYTDLPIQQCWYPNDHWRETDIEHVLDDSRLRVTARDVVPEGYRAERPGEADRYEYVNALGVASMDGEPVGNPGRPGAFIGAYMWGANAKRFATLSPSERDELVLSSLVELHPNIREVVDQVVHQVWDEDSLPGSGAFAFFKPGEFLRYQQALMEPYPTRRDPLVFFAGEHLAVLHAWIQSAVLTAWAAAAAVLRA